MSDREELISALCDVITDWDVDELGILADSIRASDWLARVKAEAGAEAIRALADRAGEIPGDSHSQAAWLRARAAELREETN